MELIDRSIDQCSLFFVLFLTTKLMFRYRMYLSFDILDLKTTMNRKQGRWGDKKTKHKLSSKKMDDNKMHWNYNCNHKFAYCSSFYMHISIGFSLYYHLFCLSKWTEITKDENDEFILTMCNCVSFVFDCFIIVGWRTFFFLLRHAFN